MTLTRVILRPSVQPDLFVPTRAPPESTGVIIAVSLVLVAPVTGGTDDKGLTDHRRPVLYILKVTSVEVYQPQGRG